MTDWIVDSHPSRENLLKKKQWKQKTRCLETETCFLETSFRVVASSDEDGEVELYLSSFPASSLVLGQIQIESSVRAFADLSSSAAVSERQFPPPLSPPSS